MKNLRRLCAAVALALALCVPAAAGEMQYGDAPPPRPAETRGEMETGSGAAPAAGGPTTEAVLRLLAGVLALL